MKFARRTEVEMPATHLAHKNEGGVTDRTVGNDGRHCGHGIVDDFVPSHDTPGPGACVTRDVKADQWFVGLKSSMDATAANLG